MVKKLWNVYYDAASCSLTNDYTGIECAVVEGYDEDDALANFDLIYGGLVVDRIEEIIEEDPI